jgi:hypothetical protein
MAMTLSRRLGHGMISLPSHDGDGAAEATLVVARCCCRCDLVVEQCRCQVMLATTLLSLAGDGTAKVILVVA